jgi:hypothetical protein
MASDKIRWYGRVDQGGSLISIEVLAIEDVQSLIEETGHPLQFPY